ncbi:MAG: hypothetical protein HW402_348 [Dehalococcoidales bacterium]|nr:hypothetical protein [Dehalococcoidales bacterium]
MRKDSQRGFTLLTLLVGMTIVILLGSTTFLVTRQIFTNRDLTEARLALTRQNLQNVGGNITALINPGQSLQIETWWLRYALVAAYGDVSISGSAEIKSEPLAGQANIYAAGNTRITGSPLVDGTITAAGSISKGGGATVTGAMWPYFPWPLVFPSDQEITVMTQQYLAEAQAGGTFSGDKTCDGSGTYELGPLHITGRLIVKDSARVKLTGTVYVGGEITMSGTASIEGPGNLVAVDNIKLTGSGRLPLENIPLIMSVSGGIDLAGSSEITALSFAPRGTIKFSPGATVYGAALGKDIDFSGPPRLVFTYPFTPR